MRAVHLGSAVGHLSAAALGHSLDFVVMTAFGAWCTTRWLRALLLR